jgi:uncharacterized protein YggU (UPF0235/DUF167 family)
VTGVAGPVRFRVRLTPRGGSDRVDGPADGRLRVRVAAPPVDGAANRALLALVADVLGVPRGAVRLAGGETSRTKLVEVAGVGRDAILARWPGLEV